MRLAAAKARYDEFVKACKSDADKYCKAQFSRARSDATVTQ